MSTIKIILNSFGLQNLKPLQITSKGYAAIDGEDAPRFDTGRDLPRTSMLGTPIISDLILSYGDIVFTFDIALIELTGRKHIVETHIQGRDGSVKEYISNADKAITIKAVLVSPYPNQYPIELVRNFEQLMKINETLGCISPVLDLLEIDALVIKDYKIRQTEGQMNVVPVEIQALQDRYLNILINA